MKAMILAAGFGSRLRPVTNRLPKPLMPVAGVPLIAYVIRLLQQAGITRIVVNLHHLGERIRHELGDGGRYGVTLRYSFEEEILGTGGGLKKVESFFDDGQTFVMVNADILLDVDLHAIVERHRQGGAHATLVLSSRPGPPDARPVEIDSEGGLLTLGGGYERPGTRHARGIFTGLQILEPEVFEYIPPLIYSGITEHVYPRMLRNGLKIVGTVVSDYWSDLGTFPSYFHANVDVIQGGCFARLDPSPLFAGTGCQPGPGMACLVPGSSIGDTTILSPPLLVGEGSRIEEGCTIGPNVVIGRDVEVGRGSSLRDCIVHDRTRIGRNARLTGVIVAEGRKIILSPDDLRKPERRI